MEIIYDYIPIGHPNRPGVKLDFVAGRIIHGTANYDAGANAKMHRSYVGRAYDMGYYMSGQDKRYGAIEYGSLNEDTGLGTRFVFGCAHAYIDRDFAVEMVPLNEYVPGAGDGCTDLSYIIFGNRQNSRAAQIELCVNDMEHFDCVLANAVEYIATRCPDATIPNFRHFDVSGKYCPAEMVDLMSDEIDPRWIDFRGKVENALYARDAIDRLAKSVGIDPEYWIPALNLKSQTDGALLARLFKKIGGIL